MTRFLKRSRQLRDKGKVLGAILALILLFLLPAGACMAQDVSRGWCGVAPTDGILVFCSVQGELIVADAATGSITNRIPLEAAVSGGLGCAPSSPAVIVYATPAISQGIAYIAGSNGKIYMYDLESYLGRSTLLDAQNPNPIIGGIATYEGQIFVASSEGTVYALDSATLEENWRWSAQGEIWATPTIYGDKLYIGSLDHNVYALNISDGKEEWCFSEANGAFVSQATVHEGVVYIGGLDRYFYALDSDSGELIWKTTNPAGNLFWCKAVISGEAIYAPNKDGNVYVYNLQDGGLIAKTDLGSAISSDPVVVDGKPIVITETGVLYCLDPNTSQETQLANLETRVISPLASQGEIVYIHTQEKETLWAFEASTGNKLWEHPIGK